MPINGEHSHSATKTWRVEIECVVPGAKRVLHFPLPRCLAGVSLDNLRFDGPRLRAMLTWLRDNCRSSNLLIGDALFKYTLQIETAKSSARCMDTARGVGAQKHAELVTALSTIPGAPISICTCESYLTHDGFLAYQQQLRHLRSSRPIFAESLRATAHAFLARKRKRGEVAVSGTEAVLLALDYLTDELALFAALSDEGWDVEVYPGSELPVLVDIMDGRISGAPAALARRTHVQLAFKSTRKENS